MLVGRLPHLKTLSNKLELKLDRAQTRDGLHGFRQESAAGCGWAGPGPDRPPKLAIIGLKVSSGVWVALKKGFRLIFSPCMEA